MKYEVQYCYVGCTIKYKGQYCYVGCTMKYKVQYCYVGYTMKDKVLYCYVRYMVTGVSFHDALSVYEGSNRRYIFCGNSMHDVYSYGNKFSLTFKSDEQINMNRFLLLYRNLSR